MIYFAWERKDQVTGRTAALGEAGYRKCPTPYSRAGGARLVMACHLLPIFIRKWEEDLRPTSESESSPGGKTTSDTAHRHQEARLAMGGSSNMQPGERPQ